jgi:hypothetical protein
MKYMLTHLYSNRTDRTDASRQPARGGVGGFRPVGNDNSLLGMNASAMKVRKVINRMPSASKTFLPVMHHIS